MNGVVLIDKPSGKTSYDIVAIIKRISGIKKVGHAGTLDPLATGVLPICLNEATKLVQFLMLNHKEYRATLLLGTGTDTLDIEGKIIAQSEPSVSKDDVKAALNLFIGRVEQIPPRFSAIKYKGRPMYKWARAGYKLDPPPRMVEIHKIEMIAMDLPYVTFEVSCSKGTYIRSLCLDIGEKLGYPACLAKLRRTRNGRFFEDQAVSIEGLQPNEIYEILKGSLISLNDALPDLKTIVVEDELATRIRRGHQPVMELREQIVFRPSNGDIVKLTTDDNQLLAIACFSDNSGTENIPARNYGFKILRVFNN